MVKSGGRTKRQSEAHRRGLEAEYVAKLYLRAKGYRILSGRYRVRVGEVDIIARDRKTIVFVEVKRRRDYSQALSSLLPKQQSRIIRAAEYWMAENSMDMNTDCRFDMIVFSAYLLPQHIKNAFSADSMHEARLKSWH